MTRRKMISTLGYLSLLSILGVSNTQNELVTKSTGELDITFESVIPKPENEANIILTKEVQ